MLNFQMISVWLVILVGSIWGLNFALYRRRSKGAKEPPGPRGLPFFGNALDLARDPGLLSTFNRWRKEYGDIVAFSAMGQRMIVVSSEKIANDLFSKRGNIYSDRGAPHAVQMFSDGMATAIIDKTDTWREQRKLMNTMLSISADARYDPIMDMESKYTLLDLLRAPQHFDGHFSRYAFGVVTRSSFGVRTDSFNDPFIQDIHKQSDFVASLFRMDKYISNLFPWALKLPNWLCSDATVIETEKQKLHNDSLGSLHALRKKMAEKTAPTCLQREYLEREQAYNLTELQAGMVFSTFLLAGTRSPHNALLGFVIVMLRYPHWMERLQQEVDHVAGDNRLPQSSDMPKLPIVRAVVKEAVRYRSVQAELGVPHKLRQDDAYEGFFFPAGTIFHINMSAMLSNEELYPNGQEFDPARWLDPSYPTFKEPLAVYPNLQNFASFGFGRRACPGAHFTELAITLMVARIAWACNIKKAIDPETKREIELNIQYEPTVNPKPLPFPAVIEPRSIARSELIAKEVNQARRNDPLGAV